MKCELDSNIKSMSGKVGNMLFKTFKRPDGKTETRAYFMQRVYRRRKKRSVIASLT